LIQTNSALALKIVRSYSKKLRLLTNRSSGAQHQLDDLNSLLKYADYYESTEYQNIAIYMYKSYLYHSNNSELNESIANKLNDLGSTESYTPSADFLSTYKEGEVIFCEGEPGSTLHIVQSGSIRISKLVDNKDTQLYVMKKGDIFGEMAILEKKFRSASAIAIENTSLLNINKSNFEIMVGQNPQLISKIIMLLSERIWYTSRIVRNSMIKDINNRIIDLLYSLVLKNRITISNNIQYNFNINFPELLSMMDIKDNYNSTINKFLNQNNNIKLESDCIICNDLYYLERQATAQKVK
jgi:CRP/FNR family transcriptional regulator